MADWTRDELVLACALVCQNGWNGLRAGRDEVVELSRLLKLAPIHAREVRTETFRSVHSVQRKTFDIATRHPAYTGMPTRGGRADQMVLRAFLDNEAQMLAEASAIREALLSGSLDGPAGIEDAEEGGVLLRLHKVRERDPRLREAKLLSVREADGAVRCEVCLFDFEGVYGELGKGYIEVHHVLPLHASGPTRTRLQDLALLCSNCHRMIHRRRSWLLPAELRTIVTRNGAGREELWEERR